MQTFDTTVLDSARSKLVDLVSQDVKLTHYAAAGSQDHYFGPCPMCGGRDRFQVFTQSKATGGQYFHCRQCQKRGDVFQYLKDKDNLSFVAAVKRLESLPAVAVENKPIPAQRASQSRRKSIY